MNPGNHNNLLDSKLDFFRRLAEQMTNENININIKVYNYVSQNFKKSGDIGIVSDGH